MVQVCAVEILRIDIHRKVDTNAGGSVDMMNSMIIVTVFDSDNG